MAVFLKIRSDGTNGCYFDLTFNGQRYRRLGGITKTEALRGQDKLRTKLLNGEYEIVKTVGNPRLEGFSKKFIERPKDHRSISRDKTFVKHLIMTSAIRGRHE